MPTPPFVYQDPLPLGDDDTEYRLLSKEGLALSSFEGRDILKVAPEALAFLAQQPDGLAELERLVAQARDKATQLELWSRIGELRVARGGDLEGALAAYQNAAQADPARSEPVVLAGLRGEIAYQQPCHYCDRCRRSFFPSGSAARPAAAEHGDHQGLAKGRLGRR